MGPAPFGSLPAALTKVGKKSVLITGWELMEPGLVHFRPTHEKRFPNTALVEPPLAAAQGQVGGGGTLGSREPAVVGSKGDHHLVVQSEGLQLVQHLPDGKVHGFHHGAVYGVLLEDAHLATSLVLGPDHFLIPEFSAGHLGGLLLVLLHEVGSPDQRSVHGVEGEHGEERLALVRFDEPAGLGCQAVRQVFARRGRP